MKSHQVTVTFTVRGDGTYSAHIVAPETPEIVATDVEHVEASALDAVMIVSDWFRYSTIEYLLEEWQAEHEG